MSQCSDPVAMVIDPFRVQLKPSPLYEQLLKFQELLFLVTHWLSPTLSAAPRIARADASGLGTEMLYSAASEDGTAASALLGRLVARSSARRAAAVGSEVCPFAPEALLNPLSPTPAALLCSGLSCVLGVP